MEIAERKVSDVTILDLTGKLTLGEGDEFLRQAISNLLTVVCVRTTSPRPAESM